MLKMSPAYSNRKTVSFAAAWLLSLCRMITQHQVNAWMPYNSGGSNNWDPNASFLWSATSKKRRKNLPLSIGRAGDQQHHEDDDGSDDADWNSRRRRLREQQKPMSYASNGEEDNDSFSSSLFFIPPTHDGILQTLRFATASVKGGATSYTVWEEEVDSDDNEQCEIPDLYKQQQTTHDNINNSDFDIMEFLGIQRAKPLIALQSTSASTISVDNDWQ